MRNLSRMTIRNKTSLLILTIAALSLSACQTLESALDTAGDIADNFTEDAFGDSIKPNTKGDLALSFTNTCPQINVVEELSKLHEFAKNEKPSVDSLISKAHMTQEQTSCVTENNNLIINMQIAIKSELGNKAKIRKNDKPFFAYPFFVAVADEKGFVLAKEVFAASVTFKRNETEHNYYENIRQIIPMRKGRMQDSLNIYLGFQLNDQQLAYNRNNIITEKPTIPEQSTQPIQVAPESTNQYEPQPLIPAIQTQE